MLVNKDYHNGSEEKDKMKIHQRIKRTLVPGEIVIKSYKVHPMFHAQFLWSIILYIAIGSLFLLWGWGENIMRFGINMSQVVRVIGYIIIGYSLWLYIYGILVWYFMGRALTNKRILKCVGIFSISEVETNLADIQTINVNQSLLGRVFNYGDLILQLKHQEERPLSMMSDPFQFKRQIVEARDALLAGKEVPPEEDNRARGDYSTAMEVAK